MLQGWHKSKWMLVEGFDAQSRFARILRFARMHDTNGKQNPVPQIKTGSSR